MKTHKTALIITIFLLQSTLQCFSQIFFSQGYIVNNNGTKISCLIKNNDWLENPKKIQYKIDENSSIVNAGIDSIKEFGIDNFSRYLRVKVKIDRSPTEINLLNDKKQPEWSEEILFLKELVCGKGGLWEYVGYERNWYFYSVDNSLPEQLIFKEYRNQDKVFENVSFRQQLFAYFQNEKTKKVEISKMKYDKETIVDYFKLYNSEYEYCVNTDFQKPDREIFNVKISGTLSYNSMSVQNAVIDSKPFVFDNKLNWLAGLEIEYFFPFNRNSWSVVLAPTFEQIYNTKTVDFKLGDILINSDKRTFDIKSIDFPIGIRYTNFLQNNSKYYFNILFNSPLNISFKKYFQYKTYGELIPNEGLSMIFGAGYCISNLSFELKYHTSRELLNQYGSWRTNFPKISISASYKFFKLIGK